MTLYDIIDPPDQEAAENAVRALLPQPDAGNHSEPPSVRSDEINYIICYVQRSGSTHLTSLLEGTGLAGKPADFFNVEYRRLPLEKRQVFDRTGAHSIADAFEKYQVQSVSEYLHTLARLTRSANGVFGLKMDLGQASILIRRGLFYNSAWRWKYIFVTRRDYLLQAISYATALQTDSWSSLSVTGKSAQFDQEAIFNAMMRLSDLTRRWECIFSLLAVDPLRIAYEDIEADPTRVVQQCLRTLGVPFDVSKLKSTSIYRRQRTSQADDWAEAIRRHARELGNPKTEPDQFANAGE